MEKVLYPRGQVTPFCTGKYIYEPKFVELFKRQ